MKDCEHNRNQPNKTPICLGIGISIGCICGALLKNIPIGLLIGVCVGAYYAVIAKRTISIWEDDEQNDERNRLVLLKNANQAFQITKHGSLILAGFCFIASKVANHESLIFVGSGLMLSFALCLFSDILTFIYYDRKI